MNTVRIGAIEIGPGAPLLLVAGPCVIESEETCVEVADTAAGIARRLGMPFVFKASFDKANRTSVASYRGPGLERGLEVLDRVRRRVGVPLMTDIHEPAHAGPAAEVVDVLQIPAFLCRQTDLLVAAGRTGKPVNVKKGQFLDPHAMRHVIAKIASTGNEQILLCERGSAFGYGDLVSDMRAIVWMKQLGCPVLYDVTHSVQRPAARDATSGGTPELAEPLALAAVAAGADGLFIETHPEPDSALSDAASMLPLRALPYLLERAVRISNALRASD